MTAPIPSPVPAPPPASSRGAAFLEVAERIGIKLCRDALWDADRCNWLGCSMEPVGMGWTPVQRSFGPDLYGGTSGVAIFLSELYRFTREPLLQRTARAGLQQAISRMEDMAPPFRAGFYSGWTGIAFAGLRLGEAFEDEALIGHAVKILRDIAKDDAEGAEVDVIGGHAGAIPALLAINERHPHQFLVDLAVRLGDKLLDSARRQEIGWSWNSGGMPTTHDLTGFAHGAGGIGYGLLELYGATSEEKYREAAREAFRYEQHWFSPQHGNWPDFRNFDDTQATQEGQWGYAMAWCHGAPGIGLARLRAFEILGEQAYKEEAEVAIRTTLQMLDPAAGYWGGANYSLCHGAAGNAELLIYASQVLGEPHYKAAAEQVGDIGVAQFHAPRMPWPGGIMGGWENPSLLLGKAGTGYFYLRLHDPVSVQSVLILLPEVQGGLWQEI